MNIIATEPCLAKSNAHDDLARTDVERFAQITTVESLDVETVTSNPLIPSDRKWAIRFDAEGTVTIVLGMKDYGRGWFSGYFASLLTTRLGIPIQCVRVYYSATLPAVLQTPAPSPVVQGKYQIGPVASAVAEVIEGLCEQVIARGRLAFAAITGVWVIDVGFDQPTGRFFVLDRDRSHKLLEVANIVRDRHTLRRRLVVQGVRLNA